MEDTGTEPVFNLKVMKAQSFFVGRRGMLVHDNSLVEPVVQPFDAVPDLAAKIELPTNYCERLNFDSAFEYYAIRSWRREPTIFG